MKFIPFLLLFVFVSFLSAPTIIRLIDKNNYTKIILDTSEEESSKIEIKEFYFHKIEYNFYLLKEHNSTTRILFKSLLKYVTVFVTKFYPPPDIF